jgi:hypothetical protein
MTYMRGVPGDTVVKVIPSLVWRDLRHPNAAILSVDDLARLQHCRHHRTAADGGARP